MKIVSGWQTLVCLGKYHIEQYIGENYIRVDLTWNEGVDWKLINSIFI